MHSWQLHEVVYSFSSNESICCRDVHRVMLMPAACQLWKLIRMSGIARAKDTTGYCFENLCMCQLQEITRTKRAYRSVNVKFNRNVRRALQSRRNYVATIPFPRYGAICLRNVCACFLEKQRLSQRISTKRHKGVTFIQPSPVTKKYKD